MRLLISSVIFVVTISGLFLFENLNKQKGAEQNQQAQIQNFLEQQNIPSTETPQTKTTTSTPKLSSTPKQEQLAPLISPTQTITPTPARTMTLAPTITRTPTPAPTLRPTSTPTPTRTQTPIPAATLTPTPQPSTPQPTPILTVAPTPTPTTTPEPTPEQSEKININTAGFDELQNITGVGEHIAQHIIDYRNTSGLFLKIEDIKNVSHIKDATFEKMKNEITI